MNVNTIKTPRKICVFGLGYVGSVTASCLAQLGHSVVGVDRDEHKVNSLNQRQAPFYEPNLGDLIRTNVDAGRLRASTSAAEGLEDADVALLCVGTPSDASGNLGLDQLQRVVEEVAAFLPGRAKRLIVAVRSTVFPGTCEEVVEPILAGKGNYAVVSNPEFLREGSAVKDFIEPSLLVIGGTNPEAVQFVADLYEPLPVEACKVSLRTAELIKYACNAFHAVKIGFANEIGSIGARLGVNATEVMEVLCKDVKLNVSPAYLKPGFAFGGSCLPKDLRAINFRASRLDMKLPLLESVLPSNQRHLERACDQVMAVGPKKIGIVGLSFKENTDDLRESPVINMLEYLIGKGRDVRVYDPHIQLATIYGANRNYLFNAIPHIGRLLQESVGDLLGWADHLVLTQNPGKELGAQLKESRLPVIDLTMIR